jgi:hypothetical protein
VTPVKQRLFIIVLLLCSTCAAADFSGLPLTFERVGSGPNFVAAGPGVKLLVSATQASFVFSVQPDDPVRMTFLGTRSDSRLAGERESVARANYFIGKNRASWRTDIEQFARLRVHDAWPGIDLIYYGNAGRPEFDLILKPGTDPHQIRFRLDGATPKLNADGDLVISGVFGEIVQHRPVIEQEGRRIDGGFKIDKDGVVGFELGDYDVDREVRIDPSITYSTYLGGGSSDSINAIAVDAAGNAYLAGTTSSFNFPTTPGSVQPVFPGIYETVAFVAKLNPSGSRLIYTTFLGGSGINAGDAANGIAVDSSGNVYVGGTTGSPNFPVTAGAISTTLNGPTDGFITKLNPTGTAIVYSTLLGGSGQETITAIATDSSGSAYVTGSTSSSNFPASTGAAQTILRSANDAFVAKLNPSGTGLLYATYLGGSAEDDAYAIAVDSAGSAYVTGSSASNDFPVTAAAFSRNIGPAPVAFVSKFNATGTAFVFSTFLGGTGGDSGNGIAVDSAGNSYIAGTSYSADFPTTSGVLNPSPPGISAYGHGFVTKLHSSGSSLLYSTYFGGSLADGANAVAIDAAGDAFITGFSYSQNFPVSPNSINPVANGSPAAFVTKLDPAGATNLYSSLVGATGATIGQSLALLPANFIYVAGFTSSPAFPTSSNAFQTESSVLSPIATTGFVMQVDLGSATACSLGLNPSNASIPLGGGSVMLSVSAPAGCAWEATLTSNWLTLSGPVSGVGAGTVVVNGGSNEANLASRSAIISAGAASMTVNQPGGSCNTPQFYPSTQTLPAGGGSGSVAISIPAGCTVSATSANSWLTLNSGVTATGNDLITFSVTANPGSNRTGSILTSGANYTFTQSGAMSSPPTVYIDAPAQGSSASGTVTVSGWAIDGATAISSVQVKVDGTLMGNATYGGYRPDVCAVFPGRTGCPNVGFVYSLNTVSLSAGSHTILVVASNSNVPAGTSSSSVTITTAGPPLLYIDNPAPSSTLTGNATVSGWALDNFSAITSVQIKVDSTWIGTAVYGGNRPDVCNVYPGRSGCPNVGFVYSLNTANLTAGNHQLTVTATDADGTPDSGSSSLNFTVPNGPPILYVDNPAQGATVSGTITVAGWAVDSGVSIGTPVASVVVKVDGTAVGAATYGGNRPDVCAVYPARPNCPNVGFSYPLNLASYSPGNHTISVFATNSDSVPVSSYFSVPIKVPVPPSVYIDVPSAGSQVGSTVTLAGWAINNTTAAATPIANIQVQVDGATSGSATYGISRPDVCTAFPGRPNCPDVGFNYSFSSSSLAPGNHTIKIIATSSDAVPIQGSASVTIVR